MESEHKRDVYISLFILIGVMAALSTVVKCCVAVNNPETIRANTEHLQFLRNR